MAPDIVANAVVAALSPGAVAGATDTAKSAIADAYEGLKSLLKKKFGHDSDVAEAIDMLEAKPDSDARKILLVEELKAVNSTSDRGVVSAAQSLLELIPTLPQGEKQVQVAQGNQESLRPTVAAPRRSPCMHRRGRVTDYPQQSAVGTGIAQA
jgi:hypothetical protein